MKLQFLVAAVTALCLTVPGFAGAPLGPALPVRHSDGDVRTRVVSPVPEKTTVPVVTTPGVAISGPIRPLRPQVFAISGPIRPLRPQAVAISGPIRPLSPQAVAVSGPIRPLRPQAQA